MKFSFIVIPLVSNLGIKCNPYEKQDALISAFLLQHCHHTLSFNDHEETQLVEGALSTGGSVPQLPATRERDREWSWLACM